MRFMSLSVTSIQGFGYGDIVHQFEKRCKFPGTGTDWKKAISGMTGDCFLLIAAEDFLRKGSVLKTQTTHCSITDP